MVVHPHCQDAARGFVWPHTMMMVPASEVEASSSRCADHMVTDGQSVCCSCGDGDDGDGWTVGDVPPVFEMVTSEDGVFLTDVIRARGWIVEDAAHL